jgi:putative transposase
MSRSRYKFYNVAQPYFLTMTVVSWYPLFSNTRIAQIILDSLKFLQRERQFIVYAYVLLENHMHLVASAPDIAKSVKEFKSFTAREIVDYLESRKAVDILSHLRFAKLSFKKKSDYQVWQEGSHPEEILSESMMIQKIEYIHMNPVKRGYVDDPAHWRYSSARNYNGMEGLLEVATDWRR